MANVENPDVSSDLSSDSNPEDQEIPDNDVDPTTEEGAEMIRRVEAVLAAGRRRRNEARHEQRRGPAIAYEIPQALYEKAQKQQDQLTEEERALLLSRGDLVGKALARPASLTTEGYKVIGWPPPVVVHASIRRATDGALSEPRDLLTKMREAIERGQLNSLSDDEIRLVAANFREGNDSIAPSCEAMASHGIPGNGEATNLLAAQEGVDIPTYGAVAMYWLRDPDVVALREARRGKAADTGSGSGSIGGAGLTMLQQPLQREDSHAADVEEQDEEGDPELNAIVDRMEELQRQRDQGDLAEDEFKQQNQGHITALRTYARNRAHPYSGHASWAPQLSSQMIRPFPRAALPNHPAHPNLSGPGIVPRNETFLNGIPFHQPPLPIFYLPAARPTTLLSTEEEEERRLNIDGLPIGPSAPARNGLP